MDSENPILRVRTELGLTQTQLGEQLGVNLSTVWRWEKGHLPVSKIVLSAVERLREQQNVPPN